jgi:hypothetical protein
MDLLPESPVTIPRISRILESYPKPLRTPGPGFDSFTEALGRELATEALMRSVASIAAPDTSFGQSCYIFQYLYDHDATMEVGSGLVELLAERVQQARLRKKGALDIDRALLFASRIASASLTDDTVARILAGKQ